MTITPMPVPQLQMIWPRSRRAMSIVLPVPVGYTLRTYRDGDADAYVGLMQRAGFNNWDMNKAQGVFSTMHTNGLFFIVHESTGLLVATAVAQNKPRELHPAGGEMGWVASDPEHRGRGLGTIVCAAVTRRLLEAGHPTMYLLTDDWRLPAIRVYLKLGWVPFLYAPDMEERWRAVCTSLGLTFDAIETALTPSGAS